MKAVNINQGEMEQQVLPLALVRGEAIVEKPQDLFIPPDALEIILESFEGPLDLLLYLIKKQKFDILDLPIAPITEQYVHYVDLMKDLNMELAADYLVMASVLAQIKSKLLLPKQQVEDEEHDPRAELIKRLQEYEIIKVAAEDIDQLPRLERDIFSASAKLTNEHAVDKLHPDVDMAELLFALQDVMKRNQALAHHHITPEILSTRERMSMIMDKLGEAGDNQFVAFDSLFSANEGRQGVVVTFLALLELLKESLIVCQQTSEFGKIYIRANEAIHAVGD